MISRFRDLIDRLFLPYATPFTPASFGLDENAFFLAVLRASPDGSTLHLGQDEGEEWVDRLRAWSSRASRKQFEADHYLIDGEFADAVERLLTEQPSSLDCLDQIVVRSPDGRFLMASIDNFSIITDLDEEILEALRDD